MKAKNKCYRRTTVVLAKDQVWLITFQNKTFGPKLNYIKFLSKKMWQSSGNTLIRDFHSQKEATLYGN